MKDQHLILLKLLETELAKTILPAAGNDMSRQIATVSGCLLSRWLVEEKLASQLRNEAIQSFAALLPALQNQIDAGLHRQLEQCLAVAVVETWPQIDALLQQVTGALLTENTPASRKLAGQLIAVDARLRDHQETAYQERRKVKPEGNTFDLGGLSEEQQACLLTFIIQRFPAETRLRITGVKPIAGGYSKQTIFIDLADNVTLPNKIVMRRDAPYVTSGTSVTMEYPVIEKVYAGGVAVAQPLALEASGKVLGTPFMLTSRVTGYNFGDYLFVTESNPVLSLDLAQKIACLHTVPIDGLEYVLEGGVISPRERVLAEIEVLDAAWQALTHYQSYTVQTAFNWLRRNVDLADGQRVIVHREIGMHNMLVRDDRIVGIFDWELCVIGARAEDVAYTYHMVRQLGDWEAFVTCYEKAAGVTLDRRQLDYYILWGMLRIAVLIARAGDAVIGGHVDNIQILYVGEYYTQTLIQRIAAKLPDVLT